MTFSVELALVLFVALALVVPGPRDWRRRPVEKNPLLAGAGHTR
jgi:hypothetical protein